MALLPALSIALTTLLTGCLAPSQAGSVATPATAPKSLAPPANERAVLTLPAIGVQIYECKANAQGMPGWSFVAPQADLFDTQGRRVGTHYAGPTWELADGSRIKGVVRERTDAPTSGAIPWLLLTASTTGGPGGLSAISNLQRINTRGGNPPTAGCASSDLGKEARVYYTADYVFYSAR
jgi:Protein of unknown function (DUF3455)